VDFITRHKDGPFFLYLPHFGVHSPHQAKPNLIAKFKPKPGVGGHNNPTYAAMIASVDESVGRVMKTLDDLKLADHTVLIFTSDNGGVGGYDRPGGLIREARARRGEGEEKKAGDEDGGGTERQRAAAERQGLPLRRRHARAVRRPRLARRDEARQRPATCPTIPRCGHLSRPCWRWPRRPKPAPGARRREPREVLWRDSAAELQRDAIFQHFPGYLGSGPGLWRTTPVSLIHSGDWKLMEYLEDGKLNSTTSGRTSAKRRT